jgi:hypothetical protein
MAAAGLLLTVAIWMEELGAVGVHDAVLIALACLMGCLAVLVQEYRKFRRKTTADGIAALARVAGRARPLEMKLM